MTQPPEAPIPGPSGQAPPPGWGQPAPQQWSTPASAPWGPPPGQGYGGGTQYPGPSGYAPPPKPGVVPLRPLGLGDVFDGSFRTMRRNPAATIGQAVLLQVLVGAITLLAMGPARGIILDPTILADEGNLDMLTNSGIWLAISGVLSAVLATFAFLLTQLLCTTPTLRAVLNLHTPLPLAWRLSRGRIGQLLLLSVIFLGLTIAGLALWAGGTFLTYTAGSGLAATLVGIFGGLAMLILATFISIRLLFAPAAIVAESLSAVASLKRSWVLTRGSWWRMFGILILCSLVVSVAVSLLSTPLSLLGGLTVPMLAPGNTAEMTPLLTGLLLLTYAVSYLSAGLGAGYLAVVTSLLYADLRIRREGLDVVLMAESDAGFSEGIPGNTPLPAAAMPPGPGTGYPQPGYQQPGYQQPGYQQGYGPGPNHPPAVPPPWNSPQR